MASPLIDLFGRALVPFAVITAFALFRKYFPAKSAEGANAPTSEELDSKFESIKWIVWTGMVVVGILFAWSTHALLVWTASYLAHRDGPADFQLLAPKVIWWFFPGFAALALSWEITLQLWSLFGNRAEANLFSDWTNNSSKYAGMDSRKILRWLALIIALPIGVLSALNLNSHAIAGPNEIRDCGYAFADCKTYPYSEARRLTTIRGFRDRNGKFVSMEGIIIDFADGRRWSSTDREDPLNPDFAVFLVQKTGLSMNFALTEADIPPLPATL